tara:strand:+ start:263 stop:751 length:489 start_codon:yes stop_codon:yes gene_type:complete
MNDLEKICNAVDDAIQDNKKVDPIQVLQIVNLKEVPNYFDQLVNDYVEIRKGLQKSYNKYEERFYSSNTTFLITTTFGAISGAIDGAIKGGYENIIMNCLTGALAGATVGYAINIIKHSYLKRVEKAWNKQFRMSRRSLIHQYSHQLAKEQVYKNLQKKDNN